MSNQFHISNNPQIIQLFNYAHKVYLNRIYKYYQIQGNDLNRFSWTGQKQVTIYLLKVFSDSEYKYSTIFFAKKSNKFKVLEADLVKETKNPLFGRINEAELKKRFNWMVNRNIIDKRLLKGIISASLDWDFSGLENDISFIKNWAQQWVDKEFDNTSIAERNPTPVNYLPENTQRYFFDRYHFNDMLQAINNEQFTDELGQCIFAYENQKWFLCASGLGSCLEHLMYIILKNYADKGYPTLRRFPKDASAGEYIKRFGLDPINIDARQATAIRVFFMARNSVDHFNTGKTQRLFCDLLFDGLSDIYNDYFEASLTAQPNQDGQ